MLGSSSSAGRYRARTRVATIDWSYTPSASRRNRSACTTSAPKPFTTRTPATLSSTTDASSADSCWIPITAGCRRVPKRLASTFINGSDPSASTVSTGSIVMRITVTAATVTPLEIVSGIITRKA